MNDDSKSDLPDSNADAAANPPPPPASGNPGPDSGAPEFDPNRTVMRPRDQPADQPPPGAVPSDPIPADDAPNAPIGGAGAGWSRAGDPHDPAAPAAPAAPAPMGQQILIDDTADAHGAGGPIEPAFPTKASRAGSAGAIIAVGTGLLAAAVVISAVRARDDGDLDWSNYGIGIGATAVLLIIALLGSFSARRVGGRAREEVITWPGVVGIGATALMIGVGIDKDDDWVGYLIGAVMIVLSAIGYLAARRAAFTVTGILGLALIYGLLFDNFVADSVDDNNSVVVGAAVIAVFVVGVTLIGWLLPSRAVTGVVVGVGGVVGFVGLMVTLVLTRFFAGFFGGMGMFDEGGEGDGFGADPSGDLGGFKESDVWWVLAFAAVLTVLWALAAAISNHPGFSILAIVMPALLIPLASAALAAEHPSRWTAILATAGGVLLLGSVVLARSRGKSVARELPYGSRT